MTDIEVVKVAPDGDVALVCGGENGGSKQLKIMVSPTALSLGSTVFKTMLGPHFKEGITLTQHSHVEIALPGDNPKALLTLCELLHLRVVEDEVQSPDHTLQLAILADKYNSYGALRVLYRIWIEKADAKCCRTRDFESCMKYLVACFYMKLPQNFHLFGHGLACFAEGDITLSAVDDYASPLQHAAVAITVQRKSWLVEMTNVVEKPMKQEFDMRSTHKTTYACRHSCTYCLDRATAFRKWLFDSPFWPLSSIPKHDVCALENALKTLKPDWLGTASPCNGWGGNLCCGLLMPKAQSLITELDKLSSRIRFTKFELCLECVANGDVEDLTGCKKNH